MKRSKLLTIPRAAARLLLATLLLTLTAQTAWADNLTSANLLIDNEIEAGTAGHYYYNMPGYSENVVKHTLTLTEQDITDNKVPFKVYDNGGKNGPFGYNVKAQLVITAPMGYAVKVEGTAKLTDNELGRDYLYIYDGTDDSAPVFKHHANHEKFGTNSNESYYTVVGVQSSTNSLMLDFRTWQSNKDGNREGLNLTISFVDASNYISYAIINMDIYQRYTGSAINLGYSVDNFKGVHLTENTDYTATIKNSNNETVTNVVEEGHYTLTIEGKGSYTGTKTIDFWVTATPGILIDSEIAEGTVGHYYSVMPKSGTGTVDLTQSNVTTFMVYDDGGKGGSYDYDKPGNFSNYANGYLLIHAPNGYQVHLTGYVRTSLDRAYLTVYDGNSESASTLCENVHGTISAANADSYKNVTVDVTSSGEYMLLHFDASTAVGNSEGLILTASIGHGITVADGITHGSVSCDNFWIKGSSTTIPLTVTPATGYRTNTVSYNDGSDHTLTADVNGDYSFTMPGKKVTVNATFAPITYTVSFNANGGTGDAMAAQNFIYDAAQNLTANTYTRTGYTFAGWATTADGNVAYADGAEVSNLVTTQGANVELFATWTANTYYVRFNANEGTGTMDNEEFTYDAAVKALTANAFTRDGYEFAGWATAADGAVAYADQAEVSNLTVTANGIFDLYAKWKKLLTNTDITISIPSQEWTGNALTPVITVTDGTTTLSEGTDYTVTAPSGTIQNADDYTFTITGAGNYSSEFTAIFKIVPKSVTIDGVSGGPLSITQDQNGYTATIDGTSETDLNITTTVTVKDVKISREFHSGQASTVILPFDYTCNDSEGGKFYAFVGVAWNDSENKWEATMKEPGDDTNQVTTLTANTPYLFMPSGTEMTFPNIPNMAGGTVTLKPASEGGNCSGTSGDGNWQFHGTYTKKTWTASDSDKDYGFAATSGTATDGTTAITAGQFVRFTSGAWMKPMRCYLSYVGTSAPAPARGMTRAASVGDDLPQSITVRLVSRGGDTTAIGTLDTKTGELSFDGWYTMDGRKLEGKPTKRGLYINNGRKIVIK